MKKILKRTLFKHLVAKISLKKREKQMMIIPLIFRANISPKAYPPTKDQAFSNLKIWKIKENLAVVLLKNQYLSQYQSVLLLNKIKKLQIFHLKVRRYLKFKNRFQKKISLNHQFNQIRLLMKLQLSSINQGMKMKSQRKVS